MSDGTAARVASGSAGIGWALFLDFDGTLAEIAPRPDAVRVDPELPPLLSRLRDLCGGALGIVTGRSIDVIEGFLPGLGLDVYGLHGMERRRDGHVSRKVVEDLPAFRAAVGHVTSDLADLPGVLIEDKGESVALHWRLAPEYEARIVAATQAAMADLGRTFRMQNGKALVEIVPRASGKGHAIDDFLSGPPYRGRRALFFGDDVTDEAGFAVVEAHDGIGVKIGPGDTVASRRLADPATLRAWLAEFAGGTADPDALAPA